MGPETKGLVLGNLLGKGARAAGLKREGRQEPELRGLEDWVGPSLLGPILDSP